MELEKIISQVTELVMSKMSGESAVEISVRPSEVAGRLEHSLLNPDMTWEQIQAGCDEAKKYRFANVCVSPYYVSRTVEYLKGSAVKVCAPVGFPHGAASTAAKLAEIRECIENGAEELDVAINMLAIKSGNLDDARKDLYAMVDATRGKAKIKAIYEQGTLYPG